MQFEQGLKFTGGRFNVGCGKHRRNNGDGADAGADQLRRIGRRDAADADERNREALPGTADQIKRRTHRIRFDAGSEKTAEGDMIGAGGQGNLRVYFAKPILNGQADRPWQVQVELEL